VDSGLRSYLGHGAPPPRLILRYSAGQNEQGWMLVSSACRPFWGGDDRPGSAWTSGYIWWVVAKIGHRELLAHYK